ncbi:MAG: hypothetical protein P4L33_04240 [Capsulimonadaceae bacterium]|nr:hypothetical protein [Capsulimonadaceae bacterium]
MGDRDATAGGIVESGGQLPYRGRHSVVRCAVDSDAIGVISFPRLYEPSPVRGLPFGGRQWALGVGSRTAYFSRGALVPG